MSLQKLKAQIFKVSETVGKTAVELIESYLIYNFLLISTIFDL
jgi:hypothetical protein